MGTHFAGGDVGRPGGVDGGALEAASRRELEGPLDAAVGRRRRRDARPLARPTDPGGACVPWKKLHQFDWHFWHSLLLP